MATKLLTGIAVALAVVLIVWLLWPSATPSAPAAPPRNAAPAAPAANPDATPDRRELDPQSTLGSVRGRVLDHRDQPIAGATVLLLSARVGQDQRVLAYIRCDAEGRFEIPCQAGWPPAVKLTVSAADCVTLNTTSVQIGGGEQILFLTRLATAYGRVIAQGTGAPLAGARLSCQSGSATTDADGNYQLGFPPDTPRTSILVHCDGFVDANLPVRAGEAVRERCDFALAPSAELLLQVIDRDTQLPIAGAELARGRSSRSARPQRADKDGRIRLHVGEGERLQFLVRAEGYCQLGWYWTVHDGPGRTPRLPLQRVATIAGRASIEGTTAMTRARVSAKNVSMGTGSRAIPSAVQRACDLPGSAFDELPAGDDLADADGRFELPVLPDPSPYVVTATLPERVAAESAPVVVARPGARAVVELLLRRGGNVSGKVQRNGECVTGEVVWRPRGERVWRGGARIGATGDYEFLCLPPGEIELAVQPSGSSVQLQLAAVTVPNSGRVQHDFLWEEALGRIAGKATRFDGRPVTGTWVLAEAEDHGCEPVSAALAPDGTFSLDVPTGHSYSVRLRVGVIEQTRSRVPVGAEYVDFHLELLGHLRIRLVDAATRQPIPRNAAERWSFLWRRSGEEQFAYANARFTVDDGFDLQLPVGNVDLLVMLDGSDYRRQPNLGLQVTAADDPAPIDLPIARGVAVRVEVGGEVPFDARLGRDHLFFLLADGQQDAVRGPFAEGSSQGNQEINGRQVWLRDPSLMEQLVTFEGDGTAVLRAQTPGVYSLRAFPGDVQFTPATVTVGEGGGTVQLQLRPK